MYKEGRCWDNINIASYDGAGPFDIPRIRPCRSYDVEKWIGFNFAKSSRPADRKKLGIHFWLDDYEFRRLWAQPKQYLPLLQQFGAVMSPDFSLYTDYPKAMKIWNVYRNAWLGRFWQDNGICLVPAVSWAEEDSYSYCFDGQPVGSVVAVSSTGAMRTKTERDLFVKGYNEMIRRLNPKEVIFSGSMPEGLLETGKIKKIGSFAEEMRERILKKQQAVPP